MPLRLIEAFYEGEKGDLVNQIREDLAIENIQEYTIGDKYMLRILINSQDSQKVIDALESRLKHEKDFGIVIIPAEGSVPKMEEPKAEDEEAEEKEKVPIWKQPFRKGTSISREELYTDIADTVSLSPIQVIMVILSAIVAAIGLVRDNSVVLVGAMVIAPMLGPNVAMSFSISLGDYELLGRSLKANLLRITVAFIFSLLLGFFINLSSLSGEILNRTVLHISDILLALSAGIAAALSYTTAISEGFIGVMVAVALMPPLVASGLLLSSGYFEYGISAFLLFVLNIVCINFATMITFFLQGIRPKKWWEQEKAKGALKKAFLLWGIMLAIMAIIVIFLF
jgi:uncharacterized hydrophobic protein (TIGR00341 family)